MQLRIVTISTESIVNHIHIRAEGICRDLHASLNAIVQCHLRNLWRLPDRADVASTAVPIWNRNPGTPKATQKKVHGQLRTSILEVNGSINVGQRGPPLSPETPFPTTFSKAGRAPTRLRFPRTIKFFSSSVGDSFSPLVWECAFLAFSLSLSLSRFQRISLWAAFWFCRRYSSWSQPWPPALFPEPLSAPPTARSVAPATSGR